MIDYNEKHQKIHKNNSKINLKVIGFEENWKDMDLGGVEILRCIFLLKGNGIKVGLISIELWYILLTFNSCFGFLST